MPDHSERFDPDRLPGRLGLVERQRLQEAARRFRQSPTASERLLWQELRGQKLGVKFRRQHPIGPLVADFCCPALRLIVEVDGPVHEGQGARDATRQRLLEERGYTVLRLSAAEVETHLPAALERIGTLLRERIAMVPSPEALMGGQNGRCRQS